MLFTGGAQLLKHHLLNECPHPDGGERRLRSYRALTALCYDKLDWDHEKAVQAGLKRDYDFGSDASSIVGTNSGETDSSNLNDEVDDDAAEADGGVRLDQDVDLMEFDESDAGSEMKEDFTKTLFSGASAVTVAAGHQTTSPTPLQYDRRQLYHPSTRVAGRRHMTTDWDGVQWERDPQNGFICPFHSCR